MNDAEKREKVIRGLERFIDDFKPFCGNRNDWQRVYDALALLKAQEPRVMTLEEIKSLPDETDVWLEESECIVVAVTISKQGENWGIVKENTTFFYGIEGNSYNDGGDYEDADYGKYWRCWTSRPTPEQRKEVPWG